MLTGNIISRRVAFYLQATGCSITHPIADDYDQYLGKNQVANQFQPVKPAQRYFLPAATQNHRYEFRTATLGYARVWVVEFGKYTFEDLGAHIELSISVKNAAGDVFKKSYRADGKTQGGKMFWAGPFGMRNAVQQRRPPVKPPPARRSFAGAIPFHSSIINVTLTICLP